ncbi:Chaperone DnaJ-domain superfamily protein [Zea mays]|uniref:Chaperone DnaJ-domain superfamily protein n=1 Tax=Zea mays TaxID=4577 RepID=A0A1D6GIE5_MAIZE|nr:Chaperone DnaJ-domain superfamily protein [Zea mays]
MAPHPQEDKSDRHSSGAGASREQERRPSKAWGILIFGLIGVTTASFAITQVRKSMDWFYTQLNKVQSTSSWTWRYTSNNSSRGSFSEEAKKRYYQRMQQEYEEEQERVVSLHIFIFFLYATINTSMDYGTFIFNAQMGV